jgi:hypothetical protein
MAIGILPYMGAINNTAGNLAIQLRNLCRSMVDFNTAIDSMGADDPSRATALEALGFATDDATNLVYLTHVLNTIAQVYYGNAVQTPAFDFDSALSALWGTS